MAKFEIPDGYKTTMSVIETETVIRDLRRNFEESLSKALSLIRVSAPLFVFPETGLNDNLSGNERPVSFDIPYIDGKNAEIVHSLAKWKRYALGKYEFAVGTGFYTEMNAIRREETLSNLHSIYVDQWDWEKVITREQRTVETLQEIVRAIYSALKQTETFMHTNYKLEPFLPDNITFVTTQEMEDTMPNATPKERENAFAKKYGAIFLAQIGQKLSSGNKHDGRAPDYDDWTLNGDIIIDYPLLGYAVELSSMGIRVDETALMRQLEESDSLVRLELPYHKALMNAELPFSVGGGIGQSRVCMVLMQRAHIGEVQCSVWPNDVLAECERRGVDLL